MKQSIGLLPVLLIAVASISLSAILIITGQLPDSIDVDGYYNSTNWIIGQGRLYREVFSEYPLLANIIFAIVRLVSLSTDSGLLGFRLAWIAINGFVYCALVMSVNKINLNENLNFNRIQIYAWLVPSVIFFALLRYDIYPAATTLIMLLAVREGRYLRASLCLGLTIALKGYAIVLVPIYFVFLVNKTNIKFAIRMVFVAIAPFVIGLVIVFLVSGWDGLIAPFKFHAIRDFNPDSSYQLLNYYLNADMHAYDIKNVAIFIQFLILGIGIALKPKSFYDLANVFAFIILGVVSFNVFYSGQFILWVLPLLCFSRSKRTLLLLFAYSVVTMGYHLVVIFPFPAVMISFFTFLFLARLFLMYSIFLDLRFKNI